jgi:hypothetical protein
LLIKKRTGVETLSTGCGGDGLGPLDGVGGGNGVVEIFTVAWPTVLLCDSLAPPQKDKRKK